MAHEYKVLGQVKPAAATAADLYTCPAATQAVGKVFCANVGGDSGMVRVGIRPDGASLDDAHWIAYDVQVPSGAVLDIEGIAVSAGDVVTVRSSTGDVSFTATGVEIT